ncbi:Crp/Fnr family transcriptional regulator [Vibrio sp. 99-8-1]|uniref:Crp/Fnr family transcriptional regulator n=1 Tax=Vibrio sp. 99-8-1 TaxID=2607602 RepID=UPI0014933856|nr:Crp/Fnr family transcriptional regulator [Vibrio sp. 99-8-1]NOI67510.1 Crp/Fnr family transcriptional regulator [Vibrio sp. 99-8-1]
MSNNLIQEQVQSGYKKMIQLMNQDEFDILTFENGKKLFTQGEIINHVYWVVDGGFSIRYTAENSKRINHGLIECQNRFFGEVELLTDLKANFDLFVKGKARIKVIPIRYMQKLLVDHPTITLWLSKKLAGDIIDITKQSFDRTLYPLSYTIALDLLEHSRHKKNNHSFPTVTSEAERFGCDERVYRRVISQLIKLNLIEKKDNNINIIDEAKLGDFIESFNM